MGLRARTGERHGCRCHLLLQAYRHLRSLVVPPATISVLPHISTLQTNVAVELLYGTPPHHAGLLPCLPFALPTGRTLAHLWHWHTEHTGRQPFHLPGPTRHLKAVPPHHHHQDLLTLPARAGTHYLHATTPPAAPAHHALHLWRATGGGTLSRRTCMDVGGWTLGMAFAGQAGWMRTVFRALAPRRCAPPRTCTAEAILT